MRVIEAPEQPRVTVATLDYAPATEGRWSRCCRKARNLGPWIVWPSWQSWACVALLLAAAVNLSRLPRNLRPMASLNARDGPAVVPGTNRVFYRAQDHSLRIRDFGSTETESEIQLEPSHNHTEPRLTRDGSLIIGVSDVDLVFWETRHGRMLGRLPLTAIGRGGLWPKQIEPSPDGKRLACTYKSGELAVWDVSAVESARLVASRPPDPQMDYAGASYSADGKFVLFEDSSTVWLGDAETLEQRLYLHDKPWRAADASWSPGGQYLVLERRDDPDRDEPPNQRLWNIDVYDPANVSKPLARIQYRSLYLSRFWGSVAGDVLVVENEALYELPSGRPLGTFRGLRDVLPGERLVIGDRIVERTSGAVLARVPEYYGGARVLADGRMLILSGWTRTYATDLSTPETPAWRSPRLWVMLPLAAWLAGSLWRDALRRARLRPGRFDALAAGTMIVAGVAALAGGVAQTAIDWNYTRGDWTGGAAASFIIPAMFCGLGVMAGSRAWLWATRLWLFCGIVVMLAGVALLRPQAITVFEGAWRPPTALLALVPLICAAAGLLALVRLGCTVASGGDRVHPQG